jgi:hypothetical protein
VRVVLATLLGAGLAGLALVSQPRSLLIALAAMALGFLLAGAKTAVDLIDLDRAEVGADALTLAALATGLARITSGDPVLTGTLLAVALAAQGIPLAVRMARCPRRSTPPPMPPGSA